MKEKDTTFTHQGLQPIMLPEPQKDGGKTVLASLWERKTTRDIREERLSPQVLSNLLWAACGVNREDGPMGRAGRTAPSGLNLQGVDVYVALPKGVYLYEAAPHHLRPVMAKDIRRMTNRRPAAGTASAVLIYVADTDIEIQLPPGAQPPKGHPPDKPLTLAIFPCVGEVDAGFIGQNVYLFCASEGLASWFYSTDREALAKAMQLRSAQKVVYCQAVGYPG
jgi:nitroreductase